MRFQSLLVLRIRHSFALDGRCTDLEITPSAATARLLSGHRWLWRPLPDGLRIVSTVDEQGNPERPLPEGSRLTFILRLLESEFALRTELPAMFAEGPPVYRPAPGSNPPTAGQATILVPEARLARGSETFLFPAGVREARYAMGGRPKPGTGATAFKVEGLGDGATLDWDEGKRSILVKVPATANAGRAFRVEYPVVPRVEPGIFAEADVPVPPPVPTGMEGESVYEIAFQARAVRWKYFFVTDLPAAQDTFVVESPAPVTFGRSDPDPSDPMTRALLGRFPESAGYRLSCFVSNQPVPCGEGPRTGLKLKRGNDGGTETLPSPALRNLCRVGGEPGLFHVLTRIAKP